VSLLPLIVPAHNDRPIRQPNWNSRRHRRPRRRDGGQIGRFSAKWCRSELWQR